jgi:hypothetical protein
MTSVLRTITYRGDQVFVVVVQRPILGCTVTAVWASHINLPHALESWKRLGLLWYWRHAVTHIKHTCKPGYGECWATHTVTILPLALPLALLLALPSPNPVPSLRPGLQRPCPCCRSAVVLLLLSAHLVRDDQLSGAVPAWSYSEDDAAATAAEVPYLR